MQLPSPLFAEVLRDARARPWNFMFRCLLVLGAPFAFAVLVISYFLLPRSVVELVGVVVVVLVILSDKSSRAMIRRASSWFRALVDSSRSSASR